MNNILKMFASKKGMSLKDNEESYILFKGEDFDDPENIIPDNEVLVTSVSTDDDTKSVSLVTSKDDINLVYEIRVIDNNTGEYQVYTPPF